MDISTKFRYRLKSGGTLIDAQKTYPNPARQSPIVSGRLILIFEVDLKNKRVADPCIREEVKAYVGNLIDYKITSVELKINHHRRPTRVELSVNTILPVYPVPEESVLTKHTQAVMKLAGLRLQAPVITNIANIVGGHLRKLDAMPASDYALHKSLQKAAALDGRKMAQLERYGLSALAKVEESRQYGPDGLGI